MNLFRALHTGARVTRGGALVATVSAALLWLAAQCAAPGRAVSVSAITRAVPVTPAALRELATHLAGTCVDSLLPGTVEDLWPPEGDSAAAAAGGALAALQKTLAACSCTVFGMEPESYEALAALTALPVSVLLVVIDYPVSGAAPLPREHFSEGIAAVGDLDPELLRLRVVNAVTRRGRSYTVRCTDGEALSGLPEEDPAGQVYLAATVDGEAYHQVAGVLCVTPVSRYTVEQHLEDWFRSMPHTRVAPRLTDPVHAPARGADR